MLTEAEAARLTEQQRERYADHLLARNHSSRSEYPAYSFEYLRRKVARHGECYLEQCYWDIEFNLYCRKPAGPEGMVRMLALLFRLPEELVSDILEGDPDAGLPSSWPDVDELKRAQKLQRL